MAQLKLKLIHGWRRLENPKGPVTYVREASQYSGQLQFSAAHYKPETLLSTTTGTLLDLCKKLSRNVRGGQTVASRSGKCSFGSFGTVVVRGESPACFQAWVLSNQRDFILITHTCPVEPDPIEVAEADQIALATGYE